MRGVTLFAAALSFSVTGCAAAFRESRPTVHLESDPPGGFVAVEKGLATTPLDVPVRRKGVSEVRINMPGFEEHHGTVRKHVNGLWLTADLATCIVPIMLCIPLFVDAVSGAWFDVEPRYRARMVPLAIVLAPAPSQRPTVPTVAVAPPPPPPPPVSTISESERKAAARAAYQEGVELQTQKSYPEALARFQDAQKLFDAPTHHLHIAQCLVATGKLVEAQESYETLTHRDVAPGAPIPFREAVESGKRELGELQPRIPTLRIQVQPSPSTLRNLVLLVNGRPLPSEVIGIARPINPGSYRITATAWGIPPARPVDITLKESDARSVDVRLGR